MLVWLSDYLIQFDNNFTVLQYITVRGIFSILTALGVSLIIGPSMIRRLNYHQIGQVVREDGPETHFSKAGTPTMGGALILITIALSTLLWSILPITTCGLFCWLRYCSALLVGLTIIAKFSNKTPLACLHGGNISGSQS